MTTRTVEPAGPVPGRRGPWPGIEHGFDVHVDGAVGYAVRLIPSGKQLAVYPTCRRALERVLEEIEEHGRHERTLAVNVLLPGGRSDLMAGGRSVRYFAESAVGRPRP
jgi:hypothetical protein